MPSGRCSASRRSRRRTAPTFTYQWLANGNAISGATHSTYVIKAAVKGKRISVRVRGVKSGYQTTTRTSSPTAKVT